MATSTVPYLHSQQSDHPVYFSLVLPTFNEKGNIEKAIQQVSQVLNKVLPDKYELIIVDDDSKDQTWAVAQSLKADYPHLIVIRRIGERGLGTAVIRGWQAAKGEILGVMDADLQHPPEVLSQLIDTIKNSDIAIASRNSQGGGVSDWSLIRRIVSRTAQWIGCLVLPGVVGLVSDPLSGYFLVRRSVISGRTLDPIGYKILIEVLAKGAKGRISEVGYVFKERKNDSSKATLKIYLEYLVHIFKLRFKGRTS